MGNMNLNSSLPMLFINLIEKAKESLCTLPLLNLNTFPKNTMLKSTSKDKICKPFEASKSEAQQMLSEVLQNKKKAEVLLLPVRVIMLKVSLTVVILSRSRVPFSCHPSLPNLRLKVYKDSEDNGLKSF